MDFANHCDCLLAADVLLDSSVLDLHNKVTPFFSSYMLIYFIYVTMVRYIGIYITSVKYFGIYGTTEKYFGIMVLW